MTGFAVPKPAVPGEVRLGDGSITINAGRETRSLVVSNDGDRPIQVGSHFHFADTNGALSFDRAAAKGFRLDIPSGTAVRFEPGVRREVTLVALAGAGVVPGLQLANSADQSAGAESAGPGSTEAREPGAHRG